MTSVKDLERCARLFEKEIAALADQLAEKESALRFEVDRLRVSMDAIVRYLTERDASFPEACCGENGRRPPTPGDGAED